MGCASGALTTGLPSARPRAPAGFAAGMLITFVPVLLVFLLFQGYFVRGLAGAVKG